MSRWKELPLVDLLVRGQVSYGVVQPGTDSNIGVPIVRVKDIRNGRIDTSAPMRVDHEISARHSRTLLSGGELLLSLVGTVGESAVVPEALNGWNVARAVAVIRSNHVNAKWLQFCFETPTVKFELESFLNTTVQSTLNLSDLKNLRIPVPPQHIRKAIAEVLGALDDKIAANTKLAATATALSEAIYNSAVAGQPVQPMSTVLRPILGGTPARARPDYWGGDHLWISAKDITGAPNGVVTDTDEKITDLAVNQTKAKPLREGSVIITARGTVGAVARLATPASFNQSCYGFEPDGVSPSILYFGVLHATKRAKAVAHGSVFDTITMRTFDHLEFPHLSGDKASALENHLRPLLDTILSCVQENRTLAATRDALLPQLMSGNLRVRDAEKLAEEVAS